MAERDDVRGAWWKSFFLAFFALMPLGWLFRAVGVVPPDEIAYIAIAAAWLVMWLILRRTSGRTAVVLDSFAKSMALWVVVPLGILAIALVMDGLGAPPWMTVVTAAVMVVGFVAAIVLWIIRTAQRSAQ